MIKNIKISRLHLVLLPLFGLSIMFFGCEGPEGPPGADGADGLAGIDGVDANETCKVCHNSGEELTGRVNQYAVSGHATGVRATYGNRESCARCHTSQGFVEFVAGVAITAPYDTPNQQNCRTCHDIHNTYTIDDWDRRVTTPPVSIQADDGTTLLSDFGAGNLCVTCHQARQADIPDLTATADVSITSSRYGPHYGPQSQMLEASAGYQVAGNLSYGTANHKAVTNTCVGCHMAAGGNYMVGGHTWKMWVDPEDEDEDGSQGHFNDTACESCHAGVDMEEKIATSKAAIDLLAAELHVILENGGYITASGSVVASSSTPLVVAPKIAGAIYNYRLITHGDHGYAVHNPWLAKALLTNSIAALTPQ